MFFIQCAAELRSRHRASPGVQRSWKKKSIEHSSKRYGKSKKKSIENPSKIHRKSIKNPSKINQNGGMGAIWLTSASWTALGTIFGRFYVPTWVQLEAQNGAKIDQKTIKQNHPKNGTLENGFV